MLTWRQSGYRQGYSDGETGAGVLIEMLVNTKAALLGKRCDKRNKSLFKGGTKLAVSYLGLRSLLCLEEETGAVRTTSIS